jgi:hypothetical protein
MSCNENIDIATTGKAYKPIRKVFAAADLTTSTLANLMVVHDGIIEFDCAILKRGGTGNVCKVVLREKKGSSGFAKAPLRLLLFKKCSLDKAKGTTLALDGTTTIEEAFEPIEIATSDWKDYDADNAIASVECNVNIQVDADTVMLPGYLVATAAGSNAFSTGSQLSVEPQINRN